MLSSSSVQYHLNGGIITFQGTHRQYLVGRRLMRETILCHETIYSIYNIYSIYSVEVAVPLLPGLPANTNSDNWAPRLQTTHHTPVHTTHQPEKVGYKRGGGKTGRGLGQSADWLSNRSQTTAYSRHKPAIPVSYFHDTTCS